MILAMGIGIFHICLAMTVKAICYTKRFGIKENIATWGWLLLIVGGVVILSAVGIAGVLILKGRRKKHAEEKAD